MILLLLACAPPDGTARPDKEETADTDDSAGPDDTGETDSPGDTGETDTPPDTGPVDVDGDSVSPAAGDCDDGDARVYPGAPDACDAIDQDCDGEAQPEGSCGELVPLEDAAIGWWEGEAQLSSLDMYEADTDYTGDGVVDPIAFAYCVWFDGAERCNQNVVLLPGHIPDVGVRSPVEGAPFWVSEPELDYTVDFGNAGDFDGDGSTDLFVTSIASTRDRGSLYLMLGPAGRWPASGAYLADAADGWWQQAAFNDGFGADATGGHDVDGDGLADLLVNTLGTEETGWEQAALSFVPGRADGLPYGATITDETWFDATGAGSSFATLPDMDGDGIGEAAVNVSNAATPEPWAFCPSTPSATAPAARRCRPRWRPWPSTRSSAFGCIVVVPTSGTRTATASPTSRSP
ncbi:MAG: MopE-related protein [Myxococcota bacterium]